MAMLTVSAVEAARDRWVGREVPYFRVESGDGKVLDARMIHGKVTVLFYESKDALTKSRPLRNALSVFYRERVKEMHDRLVVLPVINATSGAAWPWRGLWKKALTENSQRVGFTVYGDWDGKMGSALAMNGNDTNLVIVDQYGVIRFYQSGVIGPEKAGAILSLLERIVNEGVHGISKRHAH